MEKTEVIAIRNRIIGLLVRRARVRANKSPEVCASWIGLSAEAFSWREQGLEGFSVPHLEALAYLLGLPAWQLWDENAAPAGEPAPASLPIEQIMLLRTKILATRLRQIRHTARLSQAELGQLVGQPADTIRQYEEGRQEIPLAELEIIATHCGETLAGLIDEPILPAGQSERNGQDLARLSALPVDLRRFLLDPASVPYLRIAQWLSTLSTDDLRRLASTIIDATH